MKIARTRDIAASPEQVWAVLADFGRIGRWGHGVDHAETISTVEPGPGMRRRVQSGRNVVVEEVTDWVPPKLLRYRFEGLPPFVESATNTWTLTGRGASTEVTLTTELESAGPPPTKIPLRALGQAMGRVSNGLLDGLVEHLRQPKHEEATP
ncbi:MAG: SRPBCC family protein [Acidimicrobiales bacterium]|nr:SRPBCC family protein [Acidimicrobiales bacterium]